MEIVLEVKLRDKQKPKGFNPTLLNPTMFNPTMFKLCRAFDLRSVYKNMQLIKTLIFLYYTCVKALSKNWMFLSCSCFRLPYICHLLFLILSHFDKKRKTKEDAPDPRKIMKIIISVNIRTKKRNLHRSTYFSILIMKH